MSQKDLGDKTTTANQLNGLDPNDDASKIIEDVADGIDIVKPYDPSSIDIALKNLSLSLILDRLKYGEINLQPDYQRRGGLWDNRKKSQLIESLMLKIPLPAFYFDGSENNCWLVIDGLQRLTALKEFFIEKKLALQGLEYLLDLEGKDVDSLPRLYMRRMMETQIVTYIINPGAPPNLKFNIFKRLNTGGMVLTSQEIRHALYQGFSTKYLKKLSECKEFKDATGGTVPCERMDDREMVLRFLAFYEFSSREYKGAMEQLLNQTMEYVNKEYNEVYAANVEKRFKQVMNVAVRLFDKFAFRRMPDMEKRRPVNKALFEVWTYHLAILADEQWQALEQRKDVLRREYMQMNQKDDEFIASLRNENKSSVEMRLFKIKNLIERVLAND